MQNKKVIHGPNPTSALTGNHSLRAACEPCHLPHILEREEIICTPAVCRSPALRPRTSTPVYISNSIPQRMFDRACAIEEVLRLLRPILALKYGADARSDAQREVKYI
ncbi:hypothetical protein AcV7_002062 [Taiwanofungus camphoratus]|nr:hypothetical protein AcV7_002062 [Antrodia cinnamomea]